MAGTSSGGFDFPSADHVSELFEWFLSAPGLMLDGAIRTVCSGAVPDCEVPFWLRFVLLALISGAAVAYFYRRRENFVAWVVSLYAAVIFILSLFQLVTAFYLVINPITIAVRGTIEVYRVEEILQPVTVTGDWRSNDCGYRDTVEVVQCSLSGAPLIPPFSVSINSANCGSAVEDVKPAPNQPSCLLVRERRLGCGYESILGIRNCKGRGWLSYSIAASSPSSTRDLVEEKAIEDTFEITEPFRIPLPTAVDPDRRDVTFALRLIAPDGTEALLTQDQRSDGRLTADVVGDDLVISAAAQAVE